MANVFNCPACGEMISADVSAGQQVQCPLCRKVVAVPEDAGPLAAETVSYSSVPGGAFGGSMSQGMAIAALVCGILGLLGCLPVGIVGIVLGIVALARISREPRRYRGTGMAIGGICTGGVGLLMMPLMIAILLPSLSRARELSKRVVCSANLRGIGQAMYLYAVDEDDGAFPDDINKVIKAGNATPKQFNCPSDISTASSYHYVPGYGTNSDPTQIIMDEDPSIHGGEGGNVLYQDTHVTFVKSPQLEQLIDAITLPDGTPYTPDED